MNPKKVNILGIDLDEWRLNSCVAQFGVGPTWATLYFIESSIEGRGHATALLREAKAYYEAQKKNVGGSVALNARMRKIYRKLGIKEYR